jgi:membrane protein
VGRQDLNKTMATMSYDTLKMEFKGKMISIYKQADNLSGGSLTIVGDAFRGFIEANAAESAASIAYYALFSLFPLLIFLISFASSVLENEEVQQRILDLIEQFLPTAQQLIKVNIQQALNIRGTVQIVSTIGLLWAASGVFNALGHSINRAWHTAPQRNFLFGRLVALAMVAALTGLMIVWIVFTTAFSLLPLFKIPLFGDIVIYEGYAWGILSRFIPWFVIFVLFINVYRWLPNTKVRWREALVGAGVAALGWELTNGAFRWYLSSGFASYQLVYGSLGALIALMLWIYLGSLIVLFGAHLSASVALHTRIKKKRGGSPSGKNKKRTR